jgi:phenylpyruvate tautomerase PptA (4-oxalocrotonate tautomerase family)
MGSRRSQAKKRKEREKKDELISYLTSSMMKLLSMEAITLVCCETSMV